MTSRKLALRAERLTELTANELAAVAAAGDSDKVCVGITFICPTHDCTGYYPSINAPCTTE